MTDKPYKVKRSWNDLMEENISEIIEKHRNCSSAIIAREVLQFMRTMDNKKEEKSEWFFRWIARGKANYDGMTMEQCADMIWHHPLNPYYKVNPWAEKVDAEQEHCHVREGDNTVCGSLPNVRHCPKYQEHRDEQIKITKPKLIRNAIQTPDGTVLQSRYRHHQVEYTDKNGKWYMVDGGLSYGRRSANGDEKLLYLYDDEPHEIQRDVIVWGTYGKDGDQPLKYITVAEMETSHIEAVLRDCNPIDVIKNCLVKELEERNAKKPDTPV